MELTRDSLEYGSPASPAPAASAEPPATPSADGSIR
jgi:hypothetical protein